MAGPFAPTDWQASDVQVLDSMRPWGAGAKRQVLAKLTFHTNGISGAALTYPSDGLPAPAPTLFGMRGAVNYLIPLGPFMSPAYPANVIYPFLAVPPPTSAPTEGPRIRLTRYTPATAFAGVVTSWEFTTGGVSLVLPTTNTVGISTYVIAVGN